MIRPLYLLFFLLPLAHELKAQCTSDAGTLASVPPNVCENATFEAVHSGNAVLDSNDVLVYVVYTGANPQSGTVLATSATGIFPYDPAFLDNSPVRVAAVAGTNNGSGGVDWADPCLSYSPGLIVQFFPPPTVTAIGGVLTCNTPTVQLSASANQGGVAFAWFGPGGFTSTVINPVVFFPGTYCVTVTSAAGCTATTCVVVEQDITIPSLDAGGPYGLSCYTGQTVIDGMVTSCNQCVYAWTGPGITTGATTLTPTVNQPGTYTVVLTDVTNGCTVTDAAVVLGNPVVPQSNFAVTQPSCNGLSDGAIVFTLPADGVPPFTFGWAGPNGFTSGQQNLTNIQSGVYSLSAFDANNCAYVATVNVPQPPGVQLPGGQQAITPVTCFGLSNGGINITPVGGVQPLTYQWAGPNGFTANTQDLTGVQAGTYILTITAANGCSTAPATFIISQPAQLLLDLGPVNCGSTGILAAISGGVPPYAFLWSNNVTTAVIQDPLPGTYVVTVTDANGCSVVGTYNYTGPTNNLCGYIEGRLVRDTTPNCQSDPLEPGLAGWIVSTTGSGVFYGVTDSAGYYRIPVEEGTYTVEVEAPYDPLWVVCTPSLPVGPVLPEDTVTLPDVPVQEVVDCPLMEVSISTNLLRRCFSNNYYYINYCNIGTADAVDASVTLTLDPFLSLVSSQLPNTPLGNDQHSFAVGNLAPGDCGTFWIQMQVSCDAVLGQTHCVSAEAFPHDCLPPNPQWSGASLNVRSECSGDSVRFVVKNTGMGNMTDVADYIVIEDAVMYNMGSLFLAAGDSMVITLPANGATWRIEVEQEPFHPGASSPALSVEGCSSTGAFSTGFVTQFAGNDADPWIDIECRQNIGAYDPNDKQGFPVGYGSAHYIRPGTDIEYLIRFQNTGTDTAFNVYILDTLSAWLDPGSIRLGAASHPFNFSLYGEGIMRFDFPNIMLPDSNVNEPLSHGFVQFRIAHKAGAPLETVIENSAAIYFDFNEPIITNTTQHRLGENFLSVKTWSPLRNGLALRVAPNPSVEVARVTVDGLQGGEDLRLRVCDLQGRVVREVVGTGGTFEIQRDAMPAGVYLLVLYVDGAATGNGKMIVK